MRYWCKKAEKKISTNINEIPKWCPLDNAPKKLCAICSGVGVHDVEEYYKDELPDAEEQCDHVAPEGGHYCEKCGEFLGC